MPTLRTIACDWNGCSKTQTEKVYGEGWKGWGHVAGVSLNGTDQPCFCPEHLSMIMDYIDQQGGGS